jgi:hypothetical protein
MTHAILTSLELQEIPDLTLSGSENLRAPPSQARGFTH